MLEDLNFIQEALYINFILNGLQYDESEYLDIILKCIVYNRTGRNLWQENWGLLEEISYFMTNCDIISIYSDHTEHYVCIVMTFEDEVWKVKDVSVLNNIAEINMKLSSIEALDNYYIEHDGGGVLFRLRKIHLWILKILGIYK